MAWNKHTQRWLELEVFKGKIIERRKGRGGLIYIVEQNASPNRVAYKTIQEFESNFPVDTERIDREARNWFSFSGHPLVIKPHFAIVCDGVPLICMPYCDGDLSGLIGKGISLTAVVVLSLQIVKAMLVANKRGMDHHQDVKPENLLYIDLRTKFPGFPPPDVDPSVKYSVRIADFGVANAWRDKHLGGTNAYKAPEQHDASLYDVFAPDIFGVGLVIAELFQGYHPAAIGSGTKVWKWRGSKLKKWAIDGERHFASALNAQAQELVLLMRQMLAPDPGRRPSFQHCYDRLENVLETLSPSTLEQLKLLFRYFDYISTYCCEEDEIDRQLRLFAIPSQRESVQANIRKRLKETLDEGVVSLERAVRVHHLSKALHHTCGKDRTRHDDTDLLVEASRLAVKFVLGNHESITADCLWPAFSFGEVESKKLASDIEAKAEILNTGLERLQLLGAYDAQLKEEVDQGGEIIQACRVWSDARRAWCGGRVAQACNLLREVLLLVPHESELKRHYDLWTSARDAHSAELDSSETTA